MRNLPAAAALLGALAGLVAGDAPGQGTPARAYPDKPLRLIVPFPRAGATTSLRAWSGSACPK